MNGYDFESDDRLGFLLEYFGDRLNRIFAYYVCVLEFEGDAAMQGDPITNSRAWTLQSIKNACLHETFEGDWARVAAEVGLDAIVSARDRHHRAAADGRKFRDVG